MVKRSKTPPFHGGNTGSNPVGVTTANRKSGSTPRTWVRVMSGEHIARQVQFLSVDVGARLFGSHLTR